MTPGHEPDRSNRGESASGWEHRQSLTQGPEVQTGVYSTTPQRNASRLSHDSSLAGSAAATPMHPQHSDTELTDARVTVFHPSDATSLEDTPHASASPEQVSFRTCIVTV